MPSGSQPIEFLKKFWQTLDLLCEEGAPRLTWKSELGDDFPKFEGFLRPRQVVDSMLDPEVPGQILDLEEREDGDFDAFSREIPAHRRPLRIARPDAVRLIPDIAAIAKHIAPTLGFGAQNARPTQIGNFHELGALNLPRQQPRPVFLFLPSARPRPLALKESLLAIESAVVLLPTAVGMAFELRQVASAREIEIRILATDKELSLAPPVRGTARKPARPPLITPPPGSEWKHLTLVFEADGTRARLRGQERFATWKELGFKAFARGKLQGPLKILSTLAGGRHILQRRSNENERKQISRARKILCDLFPLPGDPFHKFSDGYGILFHVELSAVHRTARAWEDAEQDDEDAVPTGAGQFNPEDLEGFSIHST